VKAKAEKDWKAVKPANINKYDGWEIEDIVNDIENRSPKKNF